MQTFAFANGFILYNVKTNDIQGGSIQFFLQKKVNNTKVNSTVFDAIQKEELLELHVYSNLSKWKLNILKCGKDINYILNAFKHYGKKIIGYGASAKSTTFLHQYKLSNKVIDFIIDDNIYKQNYYSPGLHIPIKDSCSLNVENIDYIIILSWNFTEEILSKLKKYREIGCRIIIPFPEIQII
jgi:hypothetical protein